MVHPTIASLNSLAEVLKALQPLQSECASILQGLGGPANDQPTVDPPQASGVAKSSNPRVTVPTGPYRLRRFLAGFDREELYKKLWEMPFRYVAAEYGFSCQQLGRICKHLSVPRPATGFWSTKKAGKPLPAIPPLPPLRSELQSSSLIAPEVGLVASPAVGSGRSDVLVGTDGDGKADQISMLPVPQVLPSSQETATFDGPEVFFAPSAQQNESLGGRNANDVRAVQVVSNEKPVGSETAREKGFVISPAPSPKQIEFVADPGCRVSVRNGSEMVVPRGLMERYNREQLYQDVWSFPMSLLAKKYGVSDRALAKACRKLHVPVPTMGHWNKIAAHKPGDDKPPLPNVGIAPRTIRRKTRVHSRGEAVSIVQQIDDQLLNGTTLSAGCAAFEISEATYWRWKKASAAN